ncbi:MAG: hypothetical protein J6X86_06825 [Bacteroidales bacterium]|nr:hypothetical protein [Bacteroidales bacterium]
MKKIIVFGLALLLATSIIAQSDVTNKTTGSQKQFSVQLGLSAGATLYANGNDHSPYYSKYGFQLQIPLMANWQLSSHWKLSAGLRYDFCWMPLYYAVEPAGTVIDNFEEHGLRINQTPTTGTQKAYAFNSYVGIPIELKWYPNSERKNLFFIGLDFFAGYAVTQWFDISTVTHITDDNWSWDGYNRDTFNAMNPWKMELGLTFSTDLIGLVHGIRFFTNILPTYKDPDSGEKIYMTGITMFL